MEEEVEQGELIGFKGLPDILPVKPKGLWSELNYDELMASSEEE